MRVSPQNIDAEEAVLGAIMLDPDAISKVADILIFDAFSLVVHKQIYKCAIALHQQNKPTDLMSMATWLLDHNLLDSIGGQFKLAQLVQRTVSAVNIELYASYIVDKYIRRSLIHAANEIADLGYDTATELPIILDQAEQKIFKLNDSKSRLGLVHLSDSLISTFKELELRNSEGYTTGRMTGFYDLDAMTGGFQKSDLIIIAGRPSMGKTSFALNIAENISNKYKLPVAIFSLEMSREQLTQRLLIGRCSVESGRLKKGNLSLNEWDSVSSSIGDLSDLSIYIEDTSSVTVTQIRSEIRKLQSQSKQELGLILIDYLQLMDGAGSDRVQEISKITRSLKGLAREFNVPVVVLSQLSRGVESRTNKRPMMSDLRDSGTIEQDSDLILMLYRDSYYNPDVNNSDVTEVIISKHRNGPTGTVKLLFDNQLTKFKNLAK
jgi:replicative DNA helicase